MDDKKNKEKQVISIFANKSCPNSSCDGELIFDGQGVGPFVKMFNYFFLCSKDCGVVIMGNTVKELNISWKTASAISYRFKIKTVIRSKRLCGKKK